MRIKNNLGNNVSVAIRGGQAIVIPAGATLELDDAMYLKVEKELADMVEDESLAILKAVAKTPEQEAEEKAAKVKAAKTFLAKVEAEEKGK